MRARTVDDVSGDIFFLFLLGPCPAQAAAVAQAAPAQVAAVAQALPACLPARAAAAATAAADSRA